MAIAMTLRDYLDNTGVPYDIVAHPFSTTSVQTARLTHIASKQLAKAVVLQDSEGYVVAVVPADRRLQLGALRRKCKRMLGLATEDEVERVFFDCAPGAAPALGTAYGVEVIYDDSIADCGDVYFEAGSHTDLVHVSHGGFLDLLGDANHGSFSRQMKIAHAIHPAIQ